MTLKNSLLVAFTAVTLTSLNAGAYIVGGPIPPGQGGGGYHPGIPDVEPGFPGEPDYPLPPDDFGNGGRHDGRQERKIIYLSRRVANETLHLRQLANINQSYDGYTVESVVVDLRNSGPRAEISLVTDGRREDTAYSPQGRIDLHPRFGAVLGRDIRTLQLEVLGVADIASITVNLRERTGYERPGRPGRPGQGLDVPLFVSRRMYGNDRLDLTQYIDMYRYSGYRIQEIVIEATPVYNTALLDVLINGFNQGQTLQIDRYSYRQTVRPYNAILGQGADSIVFYTRGDLDIRGVTLRLSRY